MAWICECGQRNIVEGLPCLACDRVTSLDAAKTKAHEVASASGSRFRSDAAVEEKPAGGSRFREDPPAPQQYATAPSAPAPAGHRFRESPEELAEIEAREQEERRVVERRAQERRIEDERLARERAEHERLEQERIIAERVEQQRLAAERIERERLETERIERERAEFERAEFERAERERAENERAEVARLEAERAEQARIEAERLAFERAEAERVALEQAEHERLERERLEHERAEAERAAAERAEAERVEAERVERERAEQARAAELAEQQRIADEAAQAAQVAEAVEAAPAVNNEEVFDFDAMFPSPWSIPAVQGESADVPAQYADDTWFSAASTNDEPTPDVFDEPHENNGHVEYEEPAAQAFASFDAPYSHEVDEEDNFVERDDFVEDEDPSWFNQSQPQSGVSSVRALSGQNDASPPWWLGSGSTPFDFTALAPKDDEPSAAVMSPAESVAHLFNDDADVDEPEEHEVEDTDWQVDLADEDDDWSDRHSNRDPDVGRPAPRRKSGGSGDGSQSRSRLIAIVAALVVIALLSVVGHDVFDRVAAAPGDGQAEPKTCAEAKSTSAKWNKAATLERKFMPAWPQWQVMPDVSAQTGVVDFAKALKSESNAATALSVLDQSRYLRGYSRAYEGPSGAKITVSIYEFPAAVCATNYVQLHKEQDQATSTFDVTQVPGSVGSVQPISGTKTWVARAARENRVMTLTLTPAAGSGDQPSSLSTLITQAQVQWGLLV